MQSYTPPACSSGTRHYPSQRCAETRGVRPSGAVGSETRPDQPRRHVATQPNPPLAVPRWDRDLISGYCLERLVKTLTSDDTKETAVR